MTLPAFLGIGALKAGTTSIHALLDRHPQIALPRDRKELMFFDRYWERGLPWYEAQFAHAAGRIAGEISPNYVFDPACPARIAQVVPDVRLFLILRDPVDRAWSQYIHFRREQGYEQSFEAFLAEHPNAIERGMYAAQIRRYLDWFPADALLTIRLEDLSADPQPVVRALLRHIGADPMAPMPAPERQNPGALPAAGRLWSAGRRVARWLYDHDLAGVVDLAKRAGVRDLLLRRRAAAPPSMSPATRARLEAHYAEDQAALVSLVPVDLARPG
jgi:hypothetical protein